MAPNKAGPSPALAVFLALIGIVIAGASSFGAGAASAAAIAGRRRHPG